MKFLAHIFFVCIFLLLSFSFSQKAFALDLCMGSGNDANTAGVCFYSPLRGSGQKYETNWANACKIPGGCDTLALCSQISVRNTTYQELPSATGCQSSFGAPVRCCKPALSTVTLQSADSCQGYGASGGRVVQQGVCFYHDRDKGYSPQSNGGVQGSYDFPTCETMMAKTFGYTDQVQAISDEVKQCNGGGAAVKCCAPIKQTIAVAPPPPCNLDKNGNCTSVTTAFGNISIDIGGFVGSLFTILLSISGGVVILILILNGYTIMTSQGDAEKLKNAREAITAAIIGLVFMIFAVAILKIIGVDILRIPDFLGFR